MNTCRTDHIHEFVNHVLYSDMPFDLKAAIMVAVEPIIEIEYSEGRTQVKPVNDFKEADFTPTTPLTQ